jgi:hypothetical protein
MGDDLETSEISTLTDRQEVALSVLAVFSGTLSILGSSLIVYRVYQNRQNTSPYDRILLGLSCSDIIHSATYALSPFLLPQNTSQRVWASGTDKTCSFLGFLTQLAFAAIWYNGMLSFYYLLTVRFGVKRQAFTRRYEPYIHIFGIFYFVLTATSGLIFGFFSELEITQGCWIGEYPEGCEARGDCKGSPIGWAFGGLPFLFTFFALPINNLIILFHVRKILNKNKAGGARIKEVATQGLLYVATFYLSYLAAFIVRVLESFGFNAEQEAIFYPVLVINAFMLPLQGFFNAFIYTRPNYARVRAAFPEKSVSWTLKRACLATEIPPFASSNIPSAASKSTNNSRKNNKNNQSLLNNKFGSQGDFSSKLDLPSKLDAVREDDDEDYYFIRSSSRSREPTEASTWHQDQLAVIEKHRKPNSENEDSEDVQEASTKNADTYTYRFGPSKLNKHG